MDIISFLVSAWLMSGVLAPFESLVHAEAREDVPAGGAVDHGAVVVAPHEAAHEEHAHRVRRFADGVPVLDQLQGPLGDAPLLREVLGPALDHVLLVAGLR
jgi:hypothetical protein